MVSQTYLKRKEAGLCVLCGGEKEQPDRCACVRCLEMQNAGKLARVRKYVEAGVCINCGKNRARAGRQMCVQCSEKMNNKRRAGYAERIKEGLCTVSGCKNPVREGKVHCVEHANSYSEKHKNRPAGIGTMGRWLSRCKAVAVFGSVCGVCGNEDIRVLEFDHIKNDGKEHRKEEGRAVYWVLKHTPEEAKDRLQLLCANCHRLKHYAGEVEVSSE